MGWGVAALAADTDVMAVSGQTLTSWGLAARYGFTDVDGTTPDWGAHYREHVLAQV